jgi:hypothetical protein
MRIFGKNSQSQDIGYNLNEIPKECPRCKYAIKPVHLYSYSRNNKGLEICWLCTNCDSLFISRYTHTGSIFNGNLNIEMCAVEPQSIAPVDISDYINKVSQSFVETYNQALAADSLNLTQIVGIGLRKALEFLIKDYLCYINNNEEYKSWQLGKCISEGIQDTNIKMVAKRAVWLGNDETHYIRKWENKDLSDLKILTKLTMNFIENSLMAKKYEDEMQN